MDSTTGTQALPSAVPIQPSGPVGATGSEPAVRQSPGRRTLPHIDADELRRELAGSFSPAENAAGTTPPSGPLTTSAAPGSANVLPIEEEDDAGAQRPSARSNNSAAEPFLTLPTASGGTGQSRAPTPADANSNIDSEDAGALPATEFVPREVTPIPTRTQAAPNRSAPPTETPFSAGGRDPFAATRSGATPEPNVLVSGQAPSITTDIRGPRQVLVGREATFRVRLQNQGGVAAEGVVATVRIPSWADVLQTSVTSGSVQPSPNAASAGVLEWQLPRLESRSSETLDVRLVPRNSRPLELGVTWTAAPAGSRAVVEVQEPKLQMSVNGPDEVLFGKAQLYRFTLTNPGNGVAEDVTIDLYPPGGGEASVSSHPLGDLPPGTSQSVEVELVARDAGKLLVKAVATAAGSLSSEAAKDIFCRKPELAVDWRGPEMKYAGTEATYFFRVRNPGTAPAENVTVQVALPEGAKLTTASEGQSYDAAKRQVAWRVGSLGPGDDYYMEMKCVVNSPGLNQMRVAAETSDGELADATTAETNVVALADLKLEVSDPSGPVAVGSEVIYEIRVLNRGASAARDINVVALFSAGVEPDHVEGSLYSVSDGRVSFRTIDELPVGRQVVLRIRAHAIEAGTHVFRAEVLCRDSDIKLAAEETTRFYADDSSAIGPASPSPASQATPPPSAEVTPPPAAEANAAKAPAERY
jgi:uncharacterized repeat protein (TIGR01451 family)